MALKKEQKEKIVESLKEKIITAKSIVFVNSHGLNVAAATALRRALKDRGVGYTVVKKTLLRRALPEMPALEGEVAIAYGADPFSPAKGIYESQSKIKEGLAILGGVFEKKFLSTAEMIAIAKIPPAEELYGRLAWVLSWPVRGLVVVLDQISKTKN
ncbi:MAG: 50S ribosomal protein L10 [Candidatus Vogelbacteria bacterium]|nr:50S ribosomal protein L10 [Candidatus Vogelbacteria bacterium]